MQAIKRVDVDAAIVETVTMLADVDFLMWVIETAVAMRQAGPDPARAREKALAKLANGRKEMLDMVHPGEMTRVEVRSGDGRAREGSTGARSADPGSGPADRCQADGAEDLPCLRAIRLPEFSAAAGAVARGGEEHYRGWACEGDYDCDHLRRLSRTRSQFSTAIKIAVLAPIPNARLTIAAIAKAGARRSVPTA